jgi:hypothetical protein
LCFYQLIDLTTAEKEADACDCGIRIPLNGLYGLETTAALQPAILQNKVT